MDEAAYTELDARSERKRRNARYTDHVVLYLNSAGDFSIEDEQHRRYTIEEVREIAEDGLLADCNLSLKRLIRMDYDVAALKRWYAEQEIDDTTD